MPAIYGCEFRCRDSTKCVSRFSRCDGLKDCADGSDEALCCKEKKESSETPLLDDVFECEEPGFMRCGIDWRTFKAQCISKDRKCDGVVDCHDMSDESDCCDVSAMTGKSSPDTPRYPKMSTTRHSRVRRKTTRVPYWRAALDDDSWYRVAQITIPTFTYDLPTYGTIDTKWTYNKPNLDSGGVTGVAIVGFFLLGLMLAICRACAHRRNVRIRSISTQSLLVPQDVATDGSRVNSPLTLRRDSNRVGNVVIRSAGQAQGQVRGSRTVLIRTRSTSDLRSGNGEQATPLARSAASQQQQQQQQVAGNEQAQRTADALHLMVRDGPWLTTRTLRPMIPEQPNIPLFIEESNVRRLDDRRGVVVSTPPQLMMYVDGEFVWIPASRVPDALNFIALLSLQTEEGPSPAAPEHIEHLPTVNIPQETVDTGGRCNVCLEDFSIDEQVRELPCHHLYHSDCIVPWLQLNGTCPACREPISSAEQTDSTEGAHTTDETP